MGLVASLKGIDDIPFLARSTISSTSVGKGKRDGRLQCFVSTMCGMKLASVQVLSVPRLSCSHQMADVCRDKDAHSCTLLTAAVQSGRIQVVRAVSVFMERHNTDDEASCILLCPNFLSLREF